MALINCPSCGKKISSVAPLCPHCGLQRGEVSEEQLQEFRRRRMRDHVYHLKMASYAALTLLVAAFGWYWAETESFQYQSSMGPYLLFSIGAAVYLVIRIFLFKNKAALRKINL